MAIRQFAVYDLWTVDAERHTLQAHTFIDRLRLATDSLESLCGAARRAGQWRRRFRQLSSSPSLWGGSARRHWPARLYIIIKGRPRGASGGRSRREKGEEGGGSDLETENTRTGRTHYLCLAQIRTLHFAFKRWMQCRCRRHNICDTLVVVK